MNRMTCFFGILLCFSPLIAYGQDIKLCPSSGFLHLPPPGCALKKNFVYDQNCYTIGVVCKDGQDGSSVLASSPKPDVTTAASIDSAVQQETKPEVASTSAASTVVGTETTPTAGVATDSAGTVVPSGTTAASRPTCPPRNPDATANPANCDTNRTKCSDDAECKPGELCCADDDCGTSICKAIPGFVPPQHSEIVVAAPQATPLPTPPKPKLICPTRDPNLTPDPAKCDQNLRNCTDDAECEEGSLCCVDDHCGVSVCKKASEAEATNNISSSIDANSQQQGPTKEVVQPQEFPDPSVIVPPIHKNATARYCPVRNASIPVDSANCDKSQRTCQADSDCAIFEACCTDEDCGNTVCKASLLPCPDVEPKSENCSVLEVDKDRNCLKLVCN